MARKWKSINNKIAWKLLQTIKRRYGNNSVLKEEIWYALGPSHPREDREIATNILYKRQYLVKIGDKYEINTEKTMYEMYYELFSGERLDNTKNNTTLATKQDYEEGSFEKLAEMLNKKYPRIRK